MSYLTGKWKKKNNKFTGVSCIPLVGSCILNVEPYIEGGDTIMNATITGEGYWSVSSDGGVSVTPGDRYTHARVYMFDTNPGETEVCLIADGGKDMLKLHEAGGDAVSWAEMKLHHWIDPYNNLYSNLGTPRPEVEFAYAVNNQQEFEDIENYLTDVERGPWYAPDAAEWDIKEGDIRFNAVKFDVTTFTKAMADGVGYNPGYQQPSRINIFVRVRQWGGQVPGNMYRLWNLSYNWSNPNHPSGYIPSYPDPANQNAAPYFRVSFTEAV